MTVWQSISKRWLAALGIGFMTTQCALAVAVVSVVPAPQPAIVGSTVAVSVSITDVADLFAWQFNLSFDPTVLQLVSAAEGSFLGSAGITSFDGGVVDNSGGMISFANATLVGRVPGATGGGVLGSFVFTVAAAGTSPIGFSNLLFIDPLFADIPVQAVNGSVIAAVVPEPASAVLMGLGLGLGLAAFAAWRRRPLRASGGGAGVRPFVNLQPFEVRPLSQSR